MTNDTDRTARRTLQAALFADVVGYSQLMGEDEVGTLRAVKDLINLFKESCAKHDGSIEQISGDGIFALFSSATNAVSLAIEVQDAVARFNVSAARPIQVRMGINLGEVLQDDTGVYGDSLNIAACLENLAKPGSVYINSAVYEQIKHKLNFGYEFLGARELKNIREPVDVYCMHPEVEGIAKAVSPRAPVVQERRKQTSKPSKPSVVVLPFSD